MILLRKHKNGGKLIPKFQDSGTLGGTTYTYPVSNKPVFIAHKSNSRPIGTCNTSQCAYYITDAMWEMVDPDKTIYKSRDEYQRITGNKGNAWDRNKNFNGTPLVLDGKTSFSVGDIVYLWRPSKGVNDENYKKAQAGSLQNTHVGFIGDIDADGNPIVYDNRNKVVTASKIQWNKETQNYSIGGYAIVAAQTPTFVEKGQKQRAFKLDNNGSYASNFRGRNIAYKPEEEQTSPFMPMATNFNKYLKENFMI